jgi:putative thioredoxin
MNTSVNFEVENFEQDVIERSRVTPVLVDFWAEWCGPCKILGPVLERLAARQTGRWELRKLDTERFPEVAASYGIRSIPNVKLFVDGKVTQEFVGALPEASVEAWLAKALPPQHQKLLENVEALMHEGRTDEAREFLERIVSEDASDEHARALLGLTLSWSHPDRAAALVDGIHEASPDGMMARAVKTIGRLLAIHRNEVVLPEGEPKEMYRLAIDELARGELDRALELFITILRDHRTYDDDGGRIACLAIFAYLGEDHPVTRKRRREFSNALYA